jgi:hypothetical protein
MFKAFTKSFITPSFISNGGKRNNWESTNGVYLTLLFPVTNS